MSKARNIADSNLDDLTVDTDTLHVDSTNNRVGVGELSPTANFHVLGEAESGNGAGLRLQVNNNNSFDDLGTISFANNVQNDCATIKGITTGANQNGSITFNVNNSGLQEVMRVVNNGNVDIKSGGELHLNRGDNARSMNLYTDNDFGTIETSTDPIKIDAKASHIQFDINGSETARITSDGLTFNGDTAAANALDDYEEGNWTPTFGRTGTGFTTTPTYSNRTGRYIKVGRLVHATCNVRFSTTGFSGGSGNFKIDGLPFTAGSQLQGISFGIMSIFTNDIDFDHGNYVSGTTVQFSGNNVIASNTSLKYLTFTVQYEVS